MPKEGKISADEKVRIVESYLSGKLGCCEAGRQIGVDQRTIVKWASRYKVDGPAGFLPRKHNRTYSKEIKLSAVLEYQAGRGTMLDICEKYGVKDKRQLQSWLKMYNRHEDFTIQTGGSRMTKGRDTTVEERIEIVKACIANGNDFGGTALKYQVSYQQVYTWTKKYREMGEVGLEDRRGHRTGTLPSRTLEEELRDQIAQLERKNYDLEMENALLKKVKELERRRR
jgi:transposase